MPHTSGASSVAQGEPTAAEQALIVQAVTLARQARIKSDVIVGKLAQASVNLTSLKSLISSGHRDVKSLTGQLATFTTNFKALQAQSTQIAGLATSAEAEAAAASKKLGFGEDAIQDHIDHIQGTADHTGFLQSIEEESKTFSESSTTFNSAFTTIKVDLEQFASKRSDVATKSNEVLGVELFIKNTEKAFELGRGLNASGLQLEEAINTVNEILFSDVATKAKTSVPKSLLKKLY